MSCPACGGRVVAFAVPGDLRDHAPEGGAHAALCSRCFRIHPADTGPADPTFAVVHESFPSGEAGAALALALGLLDSLAVRRDGVDDCCTYAERAGADVLLTLDRLADAEGSDPHVDVDRRRHQLAEMLR
jgi:hypothetical protein